MDDKSRDFRGEWKTKDGHYALVEVPRLDSFKFLTGWRGKLFKSNGDFLCKMHWHSNGVSPDLEGFDLVEKKRGNETNWPNLNV